MKSDSATQMKRSSEFASDLGSDAVVEISGALRKLLADVFALYVKPRTSTGTRAVRTFVTTTCSWMSKQLKSSR